MNDKHRRSPDALLKQVQEEELQEKRGQLKIYLGAAPGVGKTYTMLQDARLKRAQGLDVVIGIVESHGREEIQNLTEGLEVLPKQQVLYRNKSIDEFNLDAALKRNPGLILLDEMAHTNAPGLRHNKRWQDIKEILDHGIDVYTTLNVQHIESLNDIIAQITHTIIKETVPDSVLELANTIELVDLPVDDLLKRLQQGKVYIAPQAEIAKEHFFRKGNLIALRELALRVTAEQVGAQALSYRHVQGIQEIWPTKEKILVCVGPGAESIKLIRAVRRLATSLQAEWIAVYVDAPRLRLSSDQHNAAVQNLRLAEQLGAEIRVLNGFDVVKEILDFSHEQNVTQIVIWKHIRSRWRDLFFKSLADEIVRRSGEINVSIITGEREENPQNKKKQITQAVPWHVYGIAAGIVALCTIINIFLFPFLSEGNLIMIYLLGVAIIALFGRLGPSIFASISSVLCYDFFFVTPFYSFSVSRIEYLITLIIMLIVAQIISNLTILARRQADMARQAANRMSALHTLSRQLASTRGINELLQVTAQYVSELFDSEVLALLPTDEHFMVRAHYGAQQELSSKDEAVVHWVFDMGKIAGLGTDTLSFSDAIYIPMQTSQATVGVLKVQPRAPQQLLTPEQMQLLEACANQAALAIEVERFHELAKKSEVRMEADRVRTYLVESLSNDLAGPLQELMKAANKLMNMDSKIEDLKIDKLATDIYLELEELNRLVEALVATEPTDKKKPEL